MRIRLRFFGRLSEAVSSAPLEEDFEDGLDVATLRARLVERHPAVAAPLGRCMIAVNTEFADPDQALVDGDEVAFLPPVSGG